MKWEDFNPAVDLDTSLYTKTKIECPKCGRYLLRDDTKILASNPPKYIYLCDCGWEGYK